MNPLPADRTANLVIWAVTGSCVFAWAVATVAIRRLPSFGSLIRVARRHFVSRWLLLAWWGWLGWHLFVRTSP